MPRLLIEIVSYLATSSFLVWIMFHKEEPKDWSLSDFMDEAAYPSVSCLWPLHQRLYHSQCLYGKYYPIHASWASSVDFALSYCASAYITASDKMLANLLPGPHH